MKDHEKRELINKLTEIAVKYGQTQQIRSRLQDALLPVLDRVADKQNARVPVVVAVSFIIRGIDYIKK